MYTTVTNHYFTNPVEFTCACCAKMTTAPQAFAKLKGLKIGHYNIRSVHYKFSLLYYLVRLYDILCVSESWLAEGYSDHKLHIPGYAFFRSDRLVDKTGGGLLLYVCNRMAPYCSIVPSLKHSNANIESLVINYTQDKHKLTSIILVYRPPSGSYVKCIDTMVEICQDPCIGTRERWILGDINVNLFEPDDSKTKYYKKAIGDLGLHDIIHHVTRPFTNGTPGGTCIDLIATDCDKVRHQGTMPQLLSDHLPVYAVKKKAKEAYENIIIKGRSYKKYDYHNFAEYILSTDWADFDTNTNVNDKWSFVLERINSYLDIHCPIKDIHFKDMKKPWMSRDIYETIHERNEYMLDYCKGGKQDPALYEMARQCRRDINAKTRIAEEVYYNNKLRDLSSNPTKFWRELNLLLGNKGSNKPDIILNHHITGEELKGPSVPPYINGYFSGIGLELFQSLGNIPVVSDDKSPSTNSHPITAETAIVRS